MRGGASRISDVDGGRDLTLTLTLTLRRGNETARTTLGSLILKLLTYIQQFLQRVKCDVAWRWLVGERKMKTTYMNMNTTTCKGVTPYRIVSYPQVCV